MAWKWLDQPEAPYGRGFILRVLVKALVLFVAANVLFAACNPLSFLGTLSVYNTLVPGRERLPYGENAAQSYNLSPTTLSVLFSAHEVTQAKKPDEFRVLVLGDSSIWGFLLHPQETLASQLNALKLKSTDGQSMTFYNLGYPEQSVTKDLLLLDQAMRYQPDLIVWATTLESLAPDTQLAPLLVRRNPDAVRALIAADHLALDPHDSRLIDPSLWDRTIVGQRRALADDLRLQLYGFTWAATGIDQYYPDQYTPRTSDFDTDVHWHMFEAPTDFQTADVAFDVLAAGIQRAGTVPVLLVNEPMFISAGQNSDLRYNFFYPRWAYDRYRTLLHQLADQQHWTLLDLWNAVAPDQFTDSPVHMTPAGTRTEAEQIAQALASLARAQTP